MSQQPKTKLIATCLAIVVIAGIVVIADHLKNISTSAGAMSIAQGANVSQTSGTNASTGGSSASAATYKDGTYTASSDYYVPHGTESIKVTLNIQNGVVADSNIVNSESDPESARFQKNFAASYKTRVVGKNISDIQVNYVAGASDTAQGFEDALSQIRSKARA